MHWQRHSATSGELPFNRYAVNWQRAFNLSHALVGCFYKRHYNGECGPALFWCSKEELAPRSLFHVDATAWCETCRRHKPKYFERMSSSRTTGGTWVDAPLVSWEIALQFDFWNGAPGMLSLPFKSECPHKFTEIYVKVKRTNSDVATCQLGKVTAPFIFILRLESSRNES